MDSRIFDQYLQGSAEVLGLDLAKLRARIVHFHSLNSKTDPTPKSKMGQGEAQIFNNFSALDFAVSRSFENRELPVEPIETFARFATTPAMKAYWASADLAAGLERIALLKPLETPNIVRIKKTESTTTLTFAARFKIHKPSLFCATEAIFLMSIMRFGTQFHILPRHVSLPAVPPHIHQQLSQYMGVEIEPSETLNITISNEDTHRPLLSALQPDPRSKRHTKRAPKQQP